MANDYNLILVDDDERNARPPMQDGRRPLAFGGRRPAIVVPPSSRPTVIQSAGAALAPRPYYPAPVSQPSQPAVIYQPAPQAPATGIAGMTTAELIEIGAQVLAALQPLPSAPTAQGDVETDVENMVLYQSALATHAKRDEQLRTLGNLLGRILRK